MEKCHFIGIGGIGMSGLARIMLNRNTQVSGSDLASSSITESLVKLGAKVYLSHSAKYISSEMTVVYNTDIKSENPEFQAALELKCRMLHRAEFLQMLMQQYKSLAVAGTHGKTTTSSILAWVLLQAGLNPAFAVGGIIPQLQGNAAHGSGDYFVAEACESDGSFLKYSPYGAIVTNIDFDHMDYYQDEEALVKAFQGFMSRVVSPEHLFWCGDDSRLSAISPLHGISYGFGKQCALKIDHFHQEGWKIFFDAEFKGKRYPQIEVSLTGKHNALNALAVFGMALSLGVHENDIRKALQTFAGVGRRCEKKGEAHGILFLDDYGHHPTEIRATLQALRQAVQERRIIVAYQPHRYSRAKDCMGMYPGVFAEADEVFVTEIYAAREMPIPGVSHESIIQEIQRDRVPCRFTPRDNIVETLGKFLRPHDVLITLGAGNITHVSREILAFLALRAPPKLKVGVIYGGVSVEHEVSLRSSKYVCSVLNQSLYDIEHFGITRMGQWVSGPQTRQTLENFLQAGNGRPYEGILTHETLEKLQECDVLFPVLHGTNGEDGTVQGFFDMLGKAYVGCDHRSAAICMDKALTKRLMQFHHIRTSPFVSFSHYQWKMDSAEWWKKIQQELTYPLFVKPIHLGSSVGVYKVEREQDLTKAIEDAFQFDTDILIENGLEGREVEFSVLGTDQVAVFPPGEILARGHVYDYEGKYGQNDIPTSARASLPKEIIEEGREFVKNAYVATGCKGMARVDTFLDRQNQFWLNEINPIPGFTQISLYPQMCEVNGLSGKDLMDRLIQLGLHRRREIDRLKKQP